MRGWVGVAAVWVRVEVGVWVRLRIGDYHVNLLLEYVGLRGTFRTKVILINTHIL